MRTRTYSQSVSTDVSATTELPFQMIIIIIVAIISITAIIAGLYYYSTSQANANAERVVDSIVSYVVQQYGSTGSDFTFDETVEGSGLSSIEYIKIGDKLQGPNNQDAGFQGFSIQWLVGGGDVSGKEFTSEAGSAIQVTANTYDICQDETTWPQPLKGDSGWGIQMVLQEGQYHLKLKTRNWDKMSNGVPETFMLIYGLVY